MIGKVNRTTFFTQEKVRESVMKETEIVMATELKIENNIVRDDTQNPGTTLKFDS